MTTIQCPHCHISLDGEADPGDEIECPACGNTFVMPARKKFTVSSSSPAPVQTIQKTSKKYKVCTIVAWLCFLTALALFIVAYNKTDFALLGAGGVLFLVGAGFGLYAKIGSWWTNG